jgi:hypothetical protein
MQTLRSLPSLAADSRERNLLRWCQVAADGLIVVGLVAVFVLVVFVVAMGLG